MERGRAIRLLLAHDLRRHAYKFLMIIPMAVYFAWTASFLMKHILDPSDEDFVMSNMFIDLFFVTGVAALGIACLRESFHKSLRLRVQTKKLSYLRQLPIDPAWLVWSRHLLVLLNAAVIYPLFYGMLNAFTNNPRLLMSPSEQVAFALTWTGYCLMVGFLYAYWELTCRESRYFAYTMVTIGVMLAIPFIMWACGIQLLLTVRDAVREYGWLPPVVSMAAAAFILRVTTRAATKRLRVRDLDV